MRLMARKVKKRIRGVSGMELWKNNHGDMLSFDAPTASQIESKNTCETASPRNGLASIDGIGKILRLSLDFLATEIILV